MSFSDRSEMLSARLSPTPRINGHNSEYEKIFFFGTHQLPLQLSVMTMIAVLFISFLCLKLC